MTYQPTQRQLLIVGFIVLNIGLITYVLMANALVTILFFFLSLSAFTKALKQDVRGGEKHE